MAAPNLTAMQAAVTRWIGEASARPDGRACLERRAEYMNTQINRLAAWAAKDTSKPAPDHLKGLTVWDLADARDRLSAAALGMAGTA